MISVSSSNLQSVGYDASTQTLRIAFHKGGVYDYSGVPKSVYDGLMGASSKGSYHASYIKNSYPYKKIR
jgi:hypothetical protein